MGGVNPDQNAEEFLRGLKKRGEFADAHGNPFPRIATLEAQVAEQQAGIALSAGAAGSSSAPVFWDGGTAIIFPTPFLVAPICETDVVTGGSVVWSSIASVSATQLVVRLHRVGGAPGAGFPIHWVARPQA